MTKEELIDLAEEHAIRIFGSCWGFNEKGLADFAAALAAAPIKPEPRQVSVDAPNYPSLYSFTGNITDLNTVCVPWAAIAAQEGKAPSDAPVLTQCGWIDQFGNVFPMGAWKPASKSWVDDHKTKWQPVYRRAAIAAQEGKNNG